MKASYRIIQGWGDQVAHQGDPQSPLHLSLHVRQPARELADRIGEAAAGVRKYAPLVGQLEARRPALAKSYSDPLLKTPQGEA